jgi:NAD-dependent deacetylase
MVIYRSFKEGPTARKVRRMAIQGLAGTESTLCDSVLLARAVLQQSKQVLVLTGAGISADSGVPIMNSSGSKWRGREYMDLAHPSAFAADPKLIWEWNCEWRSRVAACEPNDAHLALAAWAQKREDVTLVTQNVDGLHERAGHPDVIRLHGSLWKNRCTSCGTEREEASFSYDQLPSSPCCGALERPAIVWFDEKIPADALGRTIQAVQKAIAVLVIGTSGTVFPAAAFIASARRKGALIIDVNPELTEVRSHIKINAKACVVVPSLLA